MTGFSFPKNRPAIPRRSNARSAAMLQKLKNPQTWKTCPLPVIITEKTTREGRVMLILVSSLHDTSRLESKSMVLVHCVMLYVNECVVRLVRMCSSTVEKRDLCSAPLPRRNPRIEDGSCSDRSNPRVLDRQFRSTTSLRSHREDE